MSTFPHNEVSVTLGSGEESVEIHDGMDVALRPGEWRPVESLPVLGLPDGPSLLELVEALIGDHIETTPKGFEILRVKPNVLDDAKEWVARERARITGNYQGTFECVVCGERNEVCCTDGTFEDGSHTDPVCRSCCRNHDGPNIWHGKSVAGGTFERGGID